MGGAPQMPYPKWVWSPAGGWYNYYPKNWQRNAAIAAVVYASITFCVFQISAARERRPVSPVRPIPSQRWCAHAHEDDPSLRHKM
jgi:hypothetical protein